jgi:ABC-type molybdenum transport system ATPase subunit/photorepair protein PhrA
LVDSICSGKNRTLIYVSHDQANVPQCVEKIFQLEKKKEKFYSIIEPAAPAVA